MQKPERKDIFHVPSQKEIETLSFHVNDFDYIAYVKKINGGYYYSDSLQLYSVSSNGENEGILYVNILMNNAYGIISEGLFAFGQDTFGNQFCFDKNACVIFFNIETGEKEYIADSFASWEKHILNDLEYFSGLNVRMEFVKSESLCLKPADRLCPKIPFVIGGEYAINNLYNVSILDCFSVNSNICKQIYNLPEGTDILLKSID